MVYDNLVAPDILDFSPSTPSGSTLVRRQVKHTLQQEEISQLLLTNRLVLAAVSSGSRRRPLRFRARWRGVELLLANGIPVDIVPGITATRRHLRFSADAPRTRAELRLRHRHLQDHSINLNWTALARRADHRHLHGRQGPGADQRAVAGRRPARLTPAALIYRATWPEQRIYPSRPTSCLKRQRNSP